MERVVFIVSSSGLQIPCLLNPDSLLLQRRTGLAEGVRHGGVATGEPLADDPLLFTGGGVTRLTVNLLFDTQLDASNEPRDVRGATGPLWRLAENTGNAGSGARPEPVRLVWGKDFAFTGVISEIAERLEYFSAEGVPQRSFVRLQMRRVAAPVGTDPGPPLPAAEPVWEPVWELEPWAGPDRAPPEVTELAALPDHLRGARVDLLAQYFYGNPAHWRLLADANGLTDPLRHCLDHSLALRAGSWI